MPEPVTASPPAGFSIVETAQRLSISRPHVYELIKAGGLRRVKIGDRSVVLRLTIERLLVDGAGERV